MLKDNTPTILCNSCRIPLRRDGPAPVPEVHDDREIREVTADSRFRLFRE